MRTPKENASETGFGRDGGDGDFDSPLFDITSAVADARGVGPCDLPPLNDYVDVDALERLLKTASGDGTHVATQFRYDGYDVGVRSDGTVIVSPCALTDTRVSSD